MNQHTYSFPKVTPVDADQLREGLRASRRDAPVPPDHERPGHEDVAPRRPWRRPR